MALVSRLVRMLVIRGKPRNGIVYGIMKDAKYKYKLAVRQAVRSFEDQFSDELFEHLLTKDLNGFWRTGSAKTNS